MKKQIAKLREKAFKEHYIPCALCPFEIEKGPVLANCVFCADLFPGWGEFCLDENGYRSDSNFAGGYQHPMCPCYVLGEEFVAWRVELYMTTGR
jgi:hypothetical protein